MYRNVANGSENPTFRLEMKYLSLTGSIKKGADSSYPITTYDKVLIKLIVSRHPMHYRVTKADLNLQLNQITNGTKFQLYQITDKEYNLKNATSNKINLGTLLDEVTFDGKNSQYKHKGTISFDLTKLMYLTMTTDKAQYFYFVLKSNDYTFNVYDAEIQKAQQYIQMTLSGSTGLDTVCEYTQEDNGFAGVSSVNLATGKLIHKVEAIKSNDEKQPVAFHLFFNRMNGAQVPIFGNNGWTYSGDYYTIHVNGELCLVDPSGKLLNMVKCSAEDIKELYGITPIEPFGSSGDYYVCLSEMMYAAMKKDSWDEGIFVDKNKNKMFLERVGYSYYRLTKIELSSKKTITYQYGAYGVPIKITNSAGEYLALKYDSSQTRVAKVESHNKKGTLLGYVEFEYSNSNLSAITSHSGSNSTIINKASFTYDNSGYLKTINEETAGTGSEIQYSSSGQVVKIIHKFLGDPDKQKYTTFDYHTFQTRVTDYRGFYKDYFFDFIGRCRSIIDSEGKSITRNYDEVINGDPGNLNSESNLQINERNVIENSSFDSADAIFDANSGTLFDTSTGWKLVKGSASAFKVVDGGVFGQKCLKIEKQLAPIEFRQYLTNIKGGVYSFKSFFKAITANNSKLSAGDIKATINVKYKETKTVTTYSSGYGSNNVGTQTVQTLNQEKEYVLQNDLDGAFDWKGFETGNVYIPYGDNISDLSVVLSIVLNGEFYTAFIDDLSLSYGDHMVRHNYVRNGYFEKGLNGWTVGDRNYITIGKAQTDHNVVLGDNVVKFSGDSSKVRGMNQTVNITGEENEELVFTIFGKGNITKNEVFETNLKIHYTDNTTKVYTFKFDANYENWQVLTRKLVAEKAYDSVNISVSVRSRAEVCVDGIQLYKDSFGKEYSYTEKKSLSEMSSAQGFANMSYDEDNNITEATDESGDTYRYTYDKEKQLTQITNNQNARVMYRYNNGKRTETKLVSSTGEVLSTSEQFDDLGQSIAQIDDCGKKTSFAYDSIGRQTSKTEANGRQTTYTYNAYNLLQEQLTELREDKSKCTYTYDKYGNIQTIKTLNGTTYVFTYTCDQQVSHISVDGTVIVSNEYHKSHNGINTNLLTKQKLGVNDSNGYYNFTYDKKHRLTGVKFNGVDQVKYYYDERNQVCEVVDMVNGVRKYLSYDNRGNIVSATDNQGNSFAYNYDNLDNLQKTTIKIGDILRSFDYEYKCEFNDYTPSGYFTRLQKAFPDEVIKGGSGTNGVYGAKASLNTLQDVSVNVDSNSELGDSVASLLFKKDNAVVAYRMDTFNKERKSDSTYQKYFSLYDWKASFKTRKTVFGWIKPYAINGEQRIFAFATYQTTGVRFAVTAKSDGTIEFKDESANVKVVTRSSLRANEWNLVGIQISENGTGQQKTVRLVLNDEQVTHTYSNSTSMDYLGYFIIGAPSRSLFTSSNYNADTKYPSSSYALNMPFKMAYVSVGSTNISEDDFAGIYTEGSKYLHSKPNFGASGVTYYNSELYKGFDVITLNGSLTSLKRMEPKARSYAESSFRVEKARMFKFDNEGEDALYRHVYASYGSLNNLNKGRLSKLAYDFLLGYKGTITLRIKADALNNGQSERVILYAEKDGVSKFNLFIDQNGNVIFQDGNGTQTTAGKVTFGKWHFVAFRLNYNTVTVTVDTIQSRSISLAKSTDLKDALTYIGCKVEGTSKVPTAHLNGCIEMIAFKDSVATNVELNKLATSGESISVRTYYDELGRSSVKEICTKNNTLQKQYEYLKLDEKKITTTKVKKETTFDGGSINYERDEIGNLTKVTTLNAEGTIIDERSYTYDGLSRLKQSVVNGQVHNYSYDTNNNISSKDGVSYRYDSKIKDRLVSRSDGTTITYDDAFIGNPTQISMPNKTLKLAWLGRRLMSANNATYTYNESGIRLTRTIKEGFAEKYFLEGDRVAVLQRTQNGESKTITFVYDEAHMLVGLSYGGQEYFFDRDMNGEIHKIIDKDGQTVVSYQYDDWGKPTITSNGTTIGNELKELNPFMYKGYFYDQDTEMYYLKTRYYSPELGRFISADSEVGSVGNTLGMNLYSYCTCNPINYADENGNWPSWATKLCIGLAVIAVLAVAAAITVATGGAGACLVTSMLVGAIKGAAIGAVTGALMGAATGAISGALREGTWEAALEGMFTGAVEGAADGFMWGAIGGAISGAMNPKFCFIAGTMVMTSIGLKAIEEIEIGEQVLAYNDNLGIFTYEDVVDKYINETKELCHIHTGKQEIVCTPKHSILTDKGWKEAKDITVEDKIQTTKDFVKVTAVETEELETPIKVYNLNVLCYHTYVIGEQQLVVHNNCASNPTDDLYRGGDKMNVRPRDVLIKDGFVQPGKGVSVNTIPDKVVNFGKPHKVGQLPKGLDLIHTGGTHFEIAPSQAMSLEEYQQLLNTIKLIPIS